MKYKRLYNTVWIVGFTLIFTLSLDFWAWEEPIIPNAFGLPSWVYYFVMLQIIMIVAVLLFAGTYWREKEEEND